MEPKVMQKGRFTISGTVPATVESPNANRRERAARVPTGMEKSISGPSRMTNSHPATSPAPMRANPETYNTAPPRRGPENSPQVPDFAPPPPSSGPSSNQQQPVPHPHHPTPHLYHQQSLPVGVGQLANTQSGVSVVSSVSGLSSAGTLLVYGHYQGAPAENFSTELFATIQAAPEVVPTQQQPTPAQQQQQQFVPGQNNSNFATPPPMTHPPHLIHANSVPALGAFAAEQPNIVQQVTSNQSQHVIVGVQGQQYRNGPRGHPMAGPGGVVYYQYAPTHMMQAQAQYPPVMHPSAGYVALPSYPPAVQPYPQANMTPLPPPLAAVTNMPSEMYSSSTSVISDQSQAPVVNNSAPSTTATTPSPTGAPAYVHRMTKSKSGGFPANCPRGFPPRQSSEGGGTRGGIATADKTVSGINARQETDTQNKGTTTTATTATQRGNNTQPQQQSSAQSPRSPTGSVGSTSSGLNGTNVHQIGRFLLTSLTPITSPTSSPVASPYATVHSSKPATASIPHARYIKEAMTNPELTRPAMIDPHELSRKLDEVMSTTTLAQPPSAGGFDVAPLAADAKPGSVLQSASAPVGSMRRYRSPTYLTKRRSAPIVTHLAGGVPGLRNLDCANQVLPEEPPESEDQQDGSISNPGPGSAGSACGYSSGEGSNQPHPEYRQVPYSSTNPRPLHRRSQPPPSTGAAFFPNENMKPRPLSEGQTPPLNATRMASEPLPLPQPPAAPEVTNNATGEDGTRLSTVAYHHPRVMRSRSEPPTSISVCPPTPLVRSQEAIAENFTAAQPAFDDLPIFGDGDFNGPQGLAIQHVYEEVLQVRQRQEQMAAVQIEFITWARQTMCHQQQHLELVERILTGEPNACVLANTFSNLSVVTPSPGYPLPAGVDRSALAFSPQPPPPASPLPVPLTDTNLNQAQISASDPPRTPSALPDPLEQGAPNRAAESQAQSFDFTDSFTSQGVPSIDFSAINLAQTPIAIQDRKIEELAQICREQGKVSRLMLGRVLQIAGGVNVGDPENMMDTITLLDIQNEALHRENDSLRQQLALMQQQISQISMQQGDILHGAGQENPGPMTPAAPDSPRLGGW